MRLRLSPLAGAGIVVAVWWGLSAVLSVRVLPSPWIVFGRFVDLLDEGLLRHAGASLVRVLAGLGLAVVLAAPLGILMGRSSGVDRLLRPIAYLLYPVPKIALLPVVLLTIGIGDGAKIALLLLVLFFQVLVAARDAAHGVDARYIATIRSLGGRWRSVLRFVIWPVVLPRLLTALRVGSATALAVLFFAETFFTRFGLGYFIVDQWSKLAYVDMFAGILAISLLGVAIFFAIDAAERRLCPWSVSRRDETPRSKA